VAPGREQNEKAAPAEFHVAIAALAAAHHDGGQAGPLTFKSQREVGQSRPSVLNAISWQL
jgi:hypothetical protein